MSESITNTEKFQRLADAADRSASQWRQTLEDSASQLTSDRLMSLVQEIAQQEEAARIYATAARISASNAEHLAEWATETMLMPVDDTWSGRGNDLKRCVADARREALRRLILVG